MYIYIYICIHDVYERVPNVSCHLPFDVDAAFTVMLIVLLFYNTLEYSQSGRDEGAMLQSHWKVETKYTRTRAHTQTHAHKSTRAMGTNGCPKQLSTFALGGIFYKRERESGKEGRKEGRQEGRHERKPATDDEPCWGANEQVRTQTSKAPVPNYSEPTPEHPCLLPGAFNRQQPTTNSQQPKTKNQRGFRSLAQDSVCLCVCASQRNPWVNQFVLE